MVSTNFTADGQPPPPGRRKRREEARIIHARCLQAIEHMQQTMRELDRRPRMRMVIIREGPHTTCKWVPVDEPEQTAMAVHTRPRREGILSRIWKWLKALRSV